MAEDKQPISPDERHQKYWLAEIARAEKHFRDWFDKSDKLMKLYRHESVEGFDNRRFAMLWANTEVLKPAVYARSPVPQVSRRFKDKDPTGRVASELLERASSYEVERMNLDAVLRSVRDDLLLPGRGTAWVRFEADFSNGPDDEAPKAAGTEELEDDDQAPAMTETVTGQRAVVDFVPRKQFLHSPARTWEEVWWVAKISYLDKEAGEERFGERWEAADVQCDHRANKANSSEDDPTISSKAQATIYEVWCKRTGKVYFIAKQGKLALEVTAPPLRFENFWPCPKPVYSTVTTDSLIPVPDYRYYQDQAEEINRLTERIGKLTDGLKLVGFYPAGGPDDVSSAIEKALNPNSENQMIPVSSWAAFAEKGGSNAIVWLPIREVAETIARCVELRSQLVQDVYQITGISDILRGATNADETATAQSIKAQWGSIRIRDRQQEMARFSRDLIRMVCEVISENFDPMRIAQMANKVPPEVPMLPPPAPGMEQDPAYQQAQAEAQEAQAEADQLQKAMHLLRDEELRGFRIDIETDSTIQPDEDADKQRRTEFVTAIGSLMQQAIPTLQQAPELAGMIKESIMFTVRGFRAGRVLEQEIEEGFDRLVQRIEQQAANPQPDPQVEALEKKAEVEAKKAEADIQNKQTLAGLKAEETRANIGMKVVETQADIMMNREKHDANLAMTIEKAQADAARAAMMPQGARQ